MGKKQLKNTEWIILIVSVTLAIIGLVALFSATQNTELAEFKKQVQWLLISIPFLIIASTIDYNIIKAIVNECLNEYFSKQPLNESATLKTIGLSNGNISIVDNKGNVYKAKLEKIGNKNEK